MEPNDISSLFAQIPDPSVKKNPSILGNVRVENITQENNREAVKREVLTTKNAVKYLLEGTLKNKVCRYCLNVASPLSELDQILHIAGTGVLYKITIGDMIACFHPFKVGNDPNFPNKICEKCLNRVISTYLFTQQCERSERALLNCFEDMYNKLEKLDSLEPQKKRGRQKINPNYNILYTEHKNVIDYAEPIINLVNSGAELVNPEENPSRLECMKCWQVLPNMASLLNHEKLHPKSMYYHCRHCGKSFTKRNLLKRHIRTAHELEKPLQHDTTIFHCLQCGVVSEKYNQHLQHIEKHKFQMVLDHLVTRNMDKLCAVCLDNDRQLVDMDKMVCLHGGYPEMMGDRTLYAVLGSTIPEMNIIHNYAGTKICEKCLNHAITSYVFIHQAQYVRNRLGSCIALMLENLNKIDTTKGNVFVEISKDIIMPTVENDFDENLLVDEEEIDESKLQVEVLEDEFREKSEDEESESELLESDSKNSISDRKDDTYKFSNILKESEILLDNPAKRAIRTYEKSKLCNGVQLSGNKYTPLNVCSEFLTFKSKAKPKKRFYNCRFTCPLCSKHFVSDYFLKRHILKHVNKKVKCNVCYSQFTSKFYLYEHIKMYHILKQSYKSCNVCGRAFADEAKLDRHTHCHTSKECLLCNKIFRTQNHFNNHMQRHAVKLRLLKLERALTCSFCEKECSNDNELSVHVNKIHLQIKPYGCDMCEKQFYTESNLSSHKKIHSVFSKEKCQFCGKVLKCRRDLVVHVRKHIGVQPHSCMICTKTFYSSSKMKTHMVTSHGGCFGCKLCKTVFKTNNGLKDHVSVVHNII